MRRLWNEIPRRLRFALDVLLALVLLLAVYVALGCPPNGELTRFRRMERANLAGPSQILDRLDVPPEWAAVGYDRLLMGDDGEEILFFTYRRRENGPWYSRGTLWRREKTGGLLLTPVPRNWGSWGPGDLSQSLEEGKVLPLLLFADEAGAVRAELHLRLSETYDVTLVREREGEKDGYFRFDLPLESENWRQDGEILADLSATNTSFSNTREAYPATVRLYDAAGNLLETREYTIRSRAAAAEAARNAG